MELDKILHARATLNVMIRNQVQEAATAWGLEIKRYEITEITPDKHITESMDKQAAAERERRKKVRDENSTHYYFLLSFYKMKRMRKCLIQFLFANLMFAF